MHTRIQHCRSHKPGQRNVLASATTGFKEFTLRNGGAPERVFGRVGLNENQLNDINEPLDLASYVRMLELAATETGNDNFGLWFGQQFKPEMLGLIGSVALASPTLGAALSNLARLFPYHQQVTHTAFIRCGALVRLEYRILDGAIIDRRHDAELTLGMFANVLRHCLGGAWTPEVLHFEHPQPIDPRAHMQAFAAPVFFGQGTNALVFRGDRLHHKMPNGDLSKANFVCEQLIRVAGGRGVLSLLDHVKGEIRSRLPHGIPYVEVIAERVGMPRWTLQRRLANHGLSFSDVVELVRRELAERHIRQRFVPLSDIAHILGFSELSAFSRAFSRWFGVSPQRFRTNFLLSKYAEGVS
jgi:AraC-like DNA-binding protein